MLKRPVFVCGHSFYSLSLRVDRENSAFFLSYTLEGAHSYKQELPNNHFVNVVITACSSTAWGSPWVEQAGPRDGGSEGERRIKRGETGNQVMVICS